MMFSYGLKVNGKIFAVVREEAIRRETSATKNLKSELLNLKFHQS